MDSNIKETSGRELSIDWWIFRPYRDAMLYHHNQKFANFRLFQSLSSFSQDEENGFLIFLIVVPTIYIYDSRLLLS